MIHLNWMIGQITQMSSLEAYRATDFPKKDSKNNYLSKQSKIKV